MEISSIFSEKKLIDALKKAKGKPDEDLYTHLNNVGQISKEIVKRIHISYSVSEFLKKNSISEDVLKDSIVLHAYLHDIGKLDNKFQKDKQENWDSPSTRPHALFSLDLASKTTDDYLNKNYPNLAEDAKNILRPLILLSIATHHSDYHKDLYTKFKNEKPIYPEIGECAIPPYSVLQEAVDTLLEVLPNKTLRYLYSLFNGVLRLSDWMESGKIELDSTFFTDTTESQNAVERFFMRKGWALRDYQQYIKEKTFKCGFLRLPTGDGKTETALLPRLVNINKIIYTLPSVTTVESMRQRFENEYFGKGKVSFSHHMLFLTLYDEGRIEEKKYHEYNINKVVVTTIDRILLALMNYRHYPLFEISLNNSYLIVDEIHSYSPYTLSLIINALEYLHNFHNTKILVMSATLPKLIENELKNRLNATAILPSEKVNERYINKKRIKIHLKKDEFLIKANNNNYVSNILDEIKNEYNEKKKRVLVVLNTVERAKGMYNLLKESCDLKYEKEIFLIHSRFTQEDKNKKIKFLEDLKSKNEPFILVSTQILEVSLDIDFDVMYTEIAPFDALVQRCGRVNRKGEKGVCNVYVFNVENPLPYTESQIKSTIEILENPTSEIGRELESEQDFLLATDRYYEKMSKEYYSAFGLKPLEDFKYIYRSEFGENLLRTRDSTFLTLPVIPTGKDDIIYNNIKNILGNWQNFKESERNKATAEILKQSIELPIYTIRELEIKDKDLYEIFGMSFISAEYDHEVGILPKKRNVRIL
ncbi:MAG: CRISPR-associated helicase Cas3' [Thermoplasmata archaeon]